MAYRNCERCGASEEYEMLALSGSRLVCQDCDSALGHGWVEEDPENRRHPLDTFSPRP